MNATSTSSNLRSFRSPNAPAPARTRVGRKSKLTQRLQSAFARTIAKGVPFKCACDLHGLSETTAYEWMRRGERDEAPYDAFYWAVTRARARLQVALVKCAVSDGAAGARWLLERRFPEEFGAKQRVEHSGPAGAAVRFELCVGDMSDEELRRLAGGSEEDR